ncbi:CCA tRNA nucleotidyltransferase [Hydrogenimonas sp.]
MTLTLPENLEAPLREVRDYFARRYPEAKLYLVGGAVRDLVMGREVYDLDLECFYISPEDFETAMAAMGAKGVGKSFFVYKYGPIDIALPRIERKVGRGHRGFEVALAHDTKEASRRRDFTMNALMYDLQSGEIVDHWGGLEDIRQRCIRVVDPRKFVEDSLRVLRAMQFSARLKFRVEGRSAELMRSMALDDLSGERIFWEFEKMFRAPHLHYGLYTMRALEVDRKILGFEIPMRALMPMARRMLRARKLEDAAMRPFYFLFVIASCLHKNGVALSEAIHTPNVYKKVLGFQKHVPRHITDRFLGALALRHPIRQWLGIYADEVARRARKLGIYEKQFDPGVRPADLLEEGYSGKALGEELKRRQLAAVRERFKAL